MSEKDNNNNMFRFSLYQGTFENQEFKEEVVLCEKIFDADQFNPFTRYSIDIRDILPRAITKLQKTLSRRGYEVMVDVGSSSSGADEKTYDLLGYNQKMINAYPRDFRQGMRYQPQAIVQEIEQRIDQHVELKTIRGVPCKIGLYINDNPIVEREFFVDGFNPVAKQSLDVLYAVTDISDQIFDKIKKTDVMNMWDDYDLINYRGLTISQIRELSYYTRKDMLRKLRRR